MQDVSKLLKTVGVDSTVTGPNCDDSFYLNVYGLSKYPKILKILENKPKVK